MRGENRGPDDPEVGAGAHLEGWKAKWIQNWSIWMGGSRMELFQSLPCDGVFVNVGTGRMRQFWGGQQDGSPNCEGVYQFVMSWVPLSQISGMEELDFYSTD